MDDWLNLRGDSSGKPKTLRGPLVLLAILIVIGLAFFLLYKAGQHRLKSLRPQGRYQTQAVVAKLPWFSSPALLRLDRDQLWSVRG
jgi:hypothetical protein